MIVLSTNSQNTYEHAHISLTHTHSSINVAYIFHMDSLPHPPLVQTLSSVNVAHDTGLKAEDRGSAPVQSIHTLQEAIVAPIKLGDRKCDLIRDCFKIQPAGGAAVR